MLPGYRKKFYGSAYLRGDHFMILSDIEEDLPRPGFAKTVRDSKGRVVGYEENKGRERAYGQGTLAAMKYWNSPFRKLRRGWIMLKQWWNS